MTAKPAELELDYRPAGEWSAAELDALEGHPHPRIGTPRRPELRTHGRILSAFDDLFGFELFEWQLHAADVAMEILPDGTWAHSTAGVIVARQNGKTTLAARRILAGLYVLGDGNLIHLAQDRALPREVFTEVATIISDEPQLSRHLAARGGIRFTNGQEQIKLRDGSTYRILAPTESAVRGYPNVGFVLFDEIRTQLSTDVWSAVQYTQRAHPNPTRWAISNAGHDGSVVLNMLRDRGRAAAENPSSDPSMVWLEWSSEPEAPIDDPREWPRANPALGSTLRGSTLLEELRSDTPENFSTEALCRWVHVAGSQAIPWDAWERCLATIEPITPATAEAVWMAFDMDPERELAELILAAPAGDRLAVGVHRRWIGEECTEETIAAELEAEWETWSPRAIGYDPHTGGGIVDRLEGLPFEKVTGADWVVACGQLLDAVTSETLAHTGQPELNHQLANAGRRDFGDGTWRISRRDSEEPIPAVIALARAVHLAAAPGGVGITVLHSSE